MHECSLTPRGGHEYTLQCHGELRNRRDLQSCRISGHQHVPCDPPRRRSDPASGVRRSPTPLVGAWQAAERRGSSHRLSPDHDRAGGRRARKVDLPVGGDFLPLYRDFQPCRASPRIQHDRIRQGSRFCPAPARQHFRPEPHPRAGGRFSGGDKCSRHSCGRHPDTT